MWSGLSVTVIEPYEASEGLNNSRFFFVFCLKKWSGPRPPFGHRLAIASRWCVSAGRGVWGSEMGEKREKQSGEKSKFFRTERRLFCFRLWVQCLRALPERLRFPSPSWSKTVMFSLKSQITCLCLRVRKNVENIWSPSC